MNKFYALSILILTIIISCSNDEVITLFDHLENEPPEIKLDLRDSIIGIYEGTFHSFVGEYNLDDTLIRDTTYTKTFEVMKLDSTRIEFSPNIPWYGNGRYFDYETDNQYKFVDGPSYGYHLLEFQFIIDSSILEIKYDGITSPDIESLVVKMRFTGIKD